MTKTDVRSDLAEALRTDGTWSSVYIDVSGGINDPERTGELRRRTVAERLLDAGAPQADVDAIERVLHQAPGIPDPVSRFLLARAGRLEFSEVLAGEMRSAEVVSHGRAPAILPLLRHRPSEFHYIVALVGRDGGEIRLYRAGHFAAVDEREIEGETNHSRKVQVGGWSHAKYQHHAEEVWKHNQSDIAAAIDDLVQTHHPRALVLAGDGRAVQLLEEKLASASREILSKCATHSRADGASPDALIKHVTERLDSIAEADARRALDRLEQAHGRDGALGVGPVVTALQQSQADIVLVDPRRLEGRRLLALDGEPWIATAPEEAAGAAILDTVDADVAIARAATLTGARMVFVDLINNGTELPEHVGAAAVLRWSPGPPTPGVQDINS